MGRIGVWVILGLSLVGCSVPLDVAYNMIGGKTEKPQDLRYPISERMQWAAPEEEWHYDCFFLKPLKALNQSDQRIAMPSANLLFRAYHEEQRRAYRSAGQLFRQAADQGIAYALVKLGDFLLEGKGTDPNPAGGAQLILQSARLDCAYGQFRYAQLLTEGKGVRTNLPHALAWVELAVQQGYPGALALREKITPFLVPAQKQVAATELKSLRSQLDLYNKGMQNQELIQCQTKRSPKPFITRMRACHVMGGRFVGDIIDYRN